MSLFKEFPDRRFTLKHLANVSGDGSKDGRRMVLRILESLLDEGAIFEEKPGRYRISGHMLPHLEGTAEMLQSGALYVRVEGQEHDIFVDQRNTMHALDGDRVELIIIGHTRSGVPEGEVVQVLERSRRLYVGVATVDERRIFVNADPRKLQASIYMPRKLYPEVKDGEKVVVRILHWEPNAGSPTGELVEVLGAAGNNETEMHAILAEYNLPYRFDEEVERAAEAIPAEITESDYASRRDFRDRVTFTVDPTDAKDFDDALSVRRLSDGVWEVGVHIADVTHYVKPGTLLDNEARERGTSVYLVDRTVPMLPERLSNGLCSLRPNEEKLCFSAVFTINENLEIKDEWFGRTVILSDRRFDYGEAQQIIETGIGDFAEEMLTLNRLAQGLRRERLRNGAMAFERAEPKFRLDENGRPTGIYFKEQKESNQMIEEFMLLANRRVAEFCGRRKLPSGRTQSRTMVYRVHDVPNEEKLSRFRQFILRFGLMFKAASGRAVAREMNMLVRNVKGRAEENAVTLMAMRAMAKACYSTDNIGHYGLAFPYYTHFTSPIRRYPDMLVHRLLAHYLDGGRSADREEFESMCQHASEREIVAAEAERASIKYKTVEFMSDKIGQHFTGHVSGLSEWGVYVELDDTLIEGMIFLRDIGGDHWQFDDNRYEVFGLRTGRTITIGDPLRVAVKRADMQRRTLDFDLISFMRDE